MGARSNDGAGRIVGDGRIPSGSGGKISSMGSDASVRAVGASTSAAARLGGISSTDGFAAFGECFFADNEVSHLVASGTPHGSSSFTFLGAILTTIFGSSPSKRGARS